MKWIHIWWSNIYAWSLTCYELFYLWSHIIHHHNDSGINNIYMIHLPVYKNTEIKVDKYEKVNDSSHIIITNWSDLAWVGHFLSCVLSGVFIKGLSISECHSQLRVFIQNVRLVFLKTSKVISDKECRRDCHCPQVPDHTRHLCLMWCPGSGS